MSVGSGVQWIEVTERETPVFGGAEFGAVGSYERLHGTIFSELDPAHPLNAGIVNLDRAGRNARGYVEYQSDFRLLKPLDLDRGNGCLLYDVPNRGNQPIMPRLNGSPDGGHPQHPGNGFLMRRGFTLVWSGWQGDVQPGGDRLTARLPVISGITGMVREEFIAESTGLLGDNNIQELSEERFVGTLIYPVADPTGATLTVRQREADPRVAPPGLAWRLIDDRHVEITRPTALGFDRGAIYEFIYRAPRPNRDGHWLCRDPRHCLVPAARNEGQSTGTAGAAAHSLCPGFRHLAERPRATRSGVSGVQPGSGGTPGVRRHPSSRGGIAPHLH